MNFYHKYYQNRVLEGDTFPQIEWISYHIPKTAGTSFYESLGHAYGKMRIHRVYTEAAAAAMSKGEPFWSPPHKRVIHGHVRPRPRHIVQFPNAKRIIWVRDPIERVWSYLRHWVTLNRGAKLPEFKKKYMDGRNWDLPELFDALVKDKYFWDLVEVYQIAFKHVKPSEFAFVGKSEDYDNEIVRLGELMGRPMKTATENANKKNKSLPFNKSDYFSIFEAEYDFLRKWYDKDYEF